MEELSYLLPETSFNSFDVAIKVELDFQLSKIAEINIYSFYERV